MLYFQLVIMAGTVMLAYYFEYTDTFSVHVQGFFCYDPTYTKPYLGPEDSSAVPPVLLYALVAGLPTLLVSACLISNFSHHTFENAPRAFVSCEVELRRCFVTGRNKDLLKFTLQKKICCFSVHSVLKLASRNAF